MRLYPYLGLLLSTLVLASCTPQPVAVGSIGTTLAAARMLKDNGKSAEALARYDRILAACLSRADAAAQPGVAAVPGEIAQMCKDYRPAHSALTGWRDKYEKLVQSGQASAEQTQQLQQLQAALKETEQTKSTVKETPAEIQHRESKNLGPRKAV